MDAFAHTVAHDLKSPLALLTGYAELAWYECDTVPGRELRNHLERVMQTGRKMSNIIDELLLLAGIRKTEVETQELDMAAPLLVVPDTPQEKAPVISTRPGSLLRILTAFLPNFYSCFTVSYY